MVLQAEAFSDFLAQRQVAVQNVHSIRRLCYRVGASTEHDVVAQRDPLDVLQPPNRESLFTLCALGTHLNPSLAQPHRRYRDNNRVYEQTIPRRKQIIDHPASPFYHDTLDAFVGECLQNVGPEQRCSRCKSLPRGDFDNSTSYTLQDISLLLSNVPMCHDPRRLALALSRQPDHLTRSGKVPTT